ncbi:MAG: insulinase family protein [Candidatus Lambdaproteobacteria bacterium]|nr:insulinase family protein [Candidatus Lambdaproteobacteria bacterium]
MALEGLPMAPRRRPLRPPLHRTVRAIIPGMIAPWLIAPWMTAPWIAAVLALTALMAGSCQPREQVPQHAGSLLRPATAEVQYRRLVLPNDLRVMLVSDPQADRSAAAMAVGVGSLADPAGQPGLAHFLEHMLFLGTQKYPDGGEYQRFLGTRNGFSNAFTADDQTNFFFSVAHEHFEGALDRFAQFFIAPLFNPEYAEREVRAVDSEHSKNIENDFWRARQVQRTLYKPDHPINRFATGNLKTLARVGPDELKAFWRGHYSGNLMTLAVVGSRSLDQLEALVRGRFDAIENRRLPKPRFPQEYLPRKAALRVISVEPVSERRSLTIEFPLPPVQQHRQEKPLSLIAFVLGHEGAGSLLSLLKKENLAISLSAGSGESTADYASLQITIGLTPKGLAQYQTVLRYVLGTIALLRERELPRTVFDENRVMAELGWRYRESQEPGAMAQQLAGLMQDYPLETLPEGAYLYETYAPALYRTLLERLTPDNMRVTLVGRGLPVDRVEPYYQARYGYRELTGEPYALLEQARPDPQVRLPDPNPFIPRSNRLLAPEGPLKLSHLSLLRLERRGWPQPLLGQLAAHEDTAFMGGEAVLRTLGDKLGTTRRVERLATLLKSALPLPVTLLEAAEAKIWYLPDWRIRQPKAAIVLNIQSDQTYRTPRQAMLGQLYDAAMEEMLAEFGYPLRMAGLDYSIDAAASGLVLRLDGYSDRMLMLLQRLVERMQLVEIEAGAFDSIKERIQRGLDNQRFDQPYEQARYYKRLLLDSPAFSVEALRRELADVTQAEVQAYARRLFRRIYVQGVVVGNLPKDEARAALRRALDTLGGSPLPPAERVAPKVRLLSAADHVFTHRLTVNNSLVQVHYQAGPSEPRLRGALLMIGRALGDAFYFNMRTRQQLGYIVYAGVAQNEKMLGLDFLVQSGAFPADEVLNRVEAYIPQFSSTFRELPEEEFEKLRRAVIVAKLDPPKSFADTAERLYWVAFKHDARFDFQSEEIRAVETLSRAEVAAVLDRVLDPKLRRRLVIRLVGKEHASPKPRGVPIALPESVQRAAAG